MNGLHQSEDETQDGSLLRQPVPVDIVRQLDSQIDLLLACVYSPSLRRLSEVARLCRLRDLEFWVSYSEDKVEALVHIILKGLEHDQHAIPVIECLAILPEVRDIMFRVTPQLLDGLIKASIANERSFEKYSPVVVCLLTPALKTDFLLPSSINSYVLTLVQDSSQENSKSLSLLEALLRNNGGYILRSISSNQRYNMSSLLGSILGAKDTERMLHAISCLASVSMCSSHDVLLEDLKKTSSLFTGEKGQKVLRLVFSIMNNHLSPESTGRLQSTDDISPVVVNVIRALDKGTSVEWLQKKEGISAISKTLDKLDLHMDTEIVRQISRVLAEVLRTSHAQVNSLRDVATRICERAFNCLVKSNPSLNLMEALRATMDFSDTERTGNLAPLNEILKVAIKAGLSAGTWHERLELECFIVFIESLRHSENAMRSLRQAGLSEEHEHLVRAFVRSAICSGPGTERVRYFDRELCRLVLEMCIAGNPSSRNMEYVTQLLDRLTQPLQSTGKLQISVRANSPLSLQQSVNTPNSGLGSLDWRAKLMQDLQTEALHQHSFLVARLDVVCRDLERRAEINEEPLRQLESELSSVMTRVQQLETQLTEANSELDQRDSENQSAYEERQRLESAMSELIEEIEMGNNRVKHMDEKEVDRKRQVADLTDRLNTMTREVEEKTNFIRQEETRAKQVAEDSRQLLNIAESEKNRLIEKLSEMEYRMNSFEQQVLQLEGRCTTYQMEADEMRQRGVDMSSEFAIRGEEMHARENETKDLLSVQANTIAVLKQDFESAEKSLSLAAKREEKMLHDLVEIQRRGDERLSLQEVDHAASVRALQDELSLSKTRFADFISHSDQEKTALKEELAKTKSNYAKRCAEFQQAKDLSRRLMAVMGEANATQATPSSTRRTLDSTNLTPIAPHKRTKALPGSAPKRAAERVCSQGDITEDNTFYEEDKENLDHSLERRQGVERRQSGRREGSEILSELSGLGI